MDLKDYLDDDFVINRNQNRPQEQPTETKPSGATPESLASGHNATEPESESDKQSSPRVSIEEFIRTSSAAISDNLDKVDARPEQVVNQPEQQPRPEAQPEPKATATSAEAAPRATIESILDDADIKPDIKPEERSDIFFEEADEEIEEPEEEGIFESLDSTRPDFVDFEKESHFHDRERAAADIEARITDIIEARFARISARLDAIERRVDKCITDERLKKECYDMMFEEVAEYKRNIHNRLIKPLISETIGLLMEYEQNYDREFNRSAEKNNLFTKEDQ